MSNAHARFFLFLLVGNSAASLVVYNPARPCLCPYNASTSIYAKSCIVTSTRRFARCRQTIREGVGYTATRNRGTSSSSNASKKECPAKKERQRSRGHTDRQKQNLRCMKPGGIKYVRFIPGNKNVESLCIDRWLSSSGRGWNHSPHSMPPTFLASVKLPHAQTEEIGEREARRLHPGAHGARNRLCLRLKMRRGPTHWLSMPAAKLGSSNIFPRSFRCVRDMSMCCKLHPG